MSFLYKSILKFEKNDKKKCINSSYMVQ